MIRSSSPPLPPALPPLIESSIHADVVVASGAVRHEQERQRVTRACKGEVRPVKRGGYGPARVSVHRRLAGKTRVESEAPRVGR